MDAASEIRERLAIEDIVGEYVQLKRSGRNFKGLSPFSNEKSPSLMVSPEKQIWHDFSSGKGGNVFGFVMEMEGLDFKAALELLARKAGVDLGQYRSSAGDNTTKLKQRLHTAIEAAAHFYQVQLTKHTVALNYVRKEREFTKETIIAFRLGYSPPSGKALFDYLVKKGFTTEEMKRAGLVTQRQGGWGDMFRGRLMVPLSDAQGAVVGFTARILEADPNAPKYINTPATLLYDKGRQAYGLHLAKEAIRKEGFVVVVEGNLDVIASHQAGVRNVVATAGTAMTVQHLKTLKRFTGDVRLCFDQDAAGQKAAERAIDLAVQADVTLQMITIDGKDPDELIKKDVKLWKQAVDKPQYVIDWLMARYAAELDLTSAIGKRTYSDIVLRLVKRLKDSVEQDHYVGVLAKKIDVSADSLRRKMQGGAEAAARLKRPKVDTTHKSNDRDRILHEQHLLSIVLRHPSLRPILAGLPEDVFVQPEALQVHLFLLKHPDYAGEYGQGLQKVEDYVKMLVLLSEELYQDTEVDELRYQTEQLASRLVLEYAKYKKHLLASEIHTADEKTISGLLTQVKELDELARAYRPD